MSPEIGDIIKGRKIGYKGTSKYIWTACLICGREKWVLLIGGKPVSNKCYSCAKTGENNPAWNGGKRRRNGYVLIWVNLKSLFTSMRDNEGYIYEHRLVMAKHLGRCLTSEEISHHINEIRDDNRLENLKLFKNHSQHITLHNNLHKEGGDLPPLCHTQFPSSTGSNKNIK